MGSTRHCQVVSYPSQSCSCSSFPVVPLGSHWRISWGQSQGFRPTSLCVLNVGFSLVPKMGIQFYLRDILKSIISRTCDRTRDWFEKYEYTYYRASYFCPFHTLRVTLYTENIGYRCSNIAFFIKTGVGNVKIFNQRGDAIDSGPKSTLPRWAAQQIGSTFCTVPQDARQHSSCSISHAGKFRGNQQWLLRQKVGG